MVKDYLGTTELNWEKFYALRWRGISKYIGDIPELKEPLEAMSSDVVHFIHAPSGYRSAVYIIDIGGDDVVEEFYSSLVCDIYKNEQMLTKVSISELEDKAVAEKVKTTDDSNNITQQLKDLNEMYKSGALTKEEFEKAKKKLLN